jgi:hypothetical protein
LPYRSWTRGHRRAAKKTAAAFLKGVGDRSVKAHVDTGDITVQYRVAMTEGEERGLPRLGRCL